MEDEPAINLLDLVEQWATEKGYYTHLVHVAGSVSYLNIAKTATGGGYFTLWASGYISSPYAEDFPLATLRPTHPNFLKTLEGLIAKTT